MNSSFSSYHPSAVHPFLYIILVQIIPFFISPWWKIVCAARDWIHSVLNSSHTFPFSSVFILILWSLHSPLFSCIPTSQFNKGIGASLLFLVTIPRSPFSDPRIFPFKRQSTVGKCDNSLEFFPWFSRGFAFFSSLMLPFHTEFATAWCICHRLV